MSTAQGSSTDPQFPRTTARRRRRSVLSIPAGERCASACPCKRQRQRGHRSAGRTRGGKCSRPELSAEASRRSHPSSCKGSSLSSFSCSNSIELLYVHRLAALATFEKFPKSLKLGVGQRLVLGEGSHGHSATATIRQHLLFSARLPF